jgi:hypothetical protein
MDRLPLPNAIRCPALELFRRYKYPDEHTLKQFKETVIAEVLEKLVSVEDKANEGVSVPETAGAEVK